MKKQTNKLFLTILIIFTFFLLLIFSWFNYQNYIKEKSSIENNLLRLSEDITKEKNIDNKPPNNDIVRRIYMDYNAYTIILNNNNISNIINHNDNESSIDIKDIVSRIITKNNQNKVVINNLYLYNYSYYYKGNYITIIDNTNTTKRLLNNLISNIILFIILEIIVVILSNIITKYLTKPVIETFEKQKQFITDASHELKTPLSVIMASTEAYEVDKDKKWLNNIKNETDRMNELVTNLLDLSKLENNNNYIYNEENLSKIINRVVLTFESLAYENNVSIRSEIEDNIMFNCDQSSIKQLIGILLDNAIKHSYKDKEILVTLTNKNNDIILKITNYGKEIPEESYEKIFERFYREDKARSREGNRYGLGLAIAKGIVTNHKGEISVKSEDNLTTFTISFKNK